MIPPPALFAAPALRVGIAPRSTAGAGSKPPLLITGPWGRGSNTRARARRDPRRSVRSGDHVHRPERTTPSPRLRNG